MKERTGRMACWLAAIGLPLALLLTALLALSAAADDSTTNTNAPSVQYEIRIEDAQAGTLEVGLPDGFRYVGLAAGSQVAIEPEFSGDGRVAIWRGPFSGAQVLRFWLAPEGSVEPPSTLAASGGATSAVRVEPISPRAVAPRSQVPASALVDAISVSKDVEPDEIPPDEQFVTYEVVFDSDGTEIVTLERVTDTLPADFIFRGMAFGSDVITEPVGTTGDIFWENLSFTDNLTLRYYVETAGRPGVYQNSVVALAGGEQIGPASATLQISGGRVFLPVVWRGFAPPLPAWQITKTAAPTEVEEGDPVSYTAVIANVGTFTGTVGSIADTLPDGFTFLRMMPGSDVTTWPVGVGGTISWQGPWVLPPGADLTLIYEVQASGGGEKTNHVVAYGLAGEELGSASSTVTAGAALPFEDDFSQGLSPDWQPFVNYPGLSPNLWYWAGTIGVYGVYNYEWDAIPGGWTRYSLSIYNASGTQSWSNYRVEARVKDVKDTGSLKSGLTGIWFRGNYQDSGAMDGKSVGGYYVYLKPSDDRLYLMRTPPDNPSFAAATIVQSYYYAPRIGRTHWYKLIAEVQGARIKVWFEDDQDGVDNPILVFDWTDPQNAWPSGTVGFATYYTSSRFDYIRVTSLD